MNKSIKILVIIFISFTIFQLFKPKEVQGKDLWISFEDIVENYNSTTNLEFDINCDGVIDIYDLASGALDLGIIEVDNILKNYVDIISTKEKMQYSELGYKIVSERCFPITNEGIDLFEYVNAARGMNVEIIEGDNSFVVENDRIYLIGESPAMAKVRLVNQYGSSKEFYIYGTSDREQHDYTYDFLINAIKNQ